MVVENDAALLHLMVTALRYCVNREVKGFGDSTQIRQYFNGGGRADILILNVDMPAMNGFDLMTRVKQQHPHLTCIVMSGIKAHAKTAGDQGADGFLGKPFEINDLFDIVQHYVVEARREVKAF